MMAQERRVPPGAGARPRRSMNWKRFDVRALVHLPAVLDTVVADIQSVGGNLKDQFAVRLALEEAVVNALVHGHRHDAGKTVRVCYQITPQHWLGGILGQGPGLFLAPRCWA